MWHKGAFQLYQSLVNGLYIRWGLKQFQLCPDQLKSQRSYCPFFITAIISHAFWNNIYLTLPKKGKQWGSLNGEARKHGTLPTSLFQLGPTSVNILYKKVKSVQSALSDLLTTSATHGTFPRPSTKRGLILIDLELNTNARESFEHCWSYSLNLSINQHVCQFIS